MPLDLHSLKRLFDYLNETLIKEDLSTRKKIYDMQPKLRLSITTNLVKSVQQEQKDKVRVLHIKNQAELNKLQPEMTKLKDQITSVVNLIGYYESILHCSINLANRKINSCQEHSFILSLALLQLYGTQSQNCFEIIKLELQDGRNHAQVVMNRDPLSILEDPETWGENCLVLDSHGGWYSKVSELPADTAIKNLYDYKNFSGVKITVDVRLDMELATLTKYLNKPNHPLHQVELFTHQYLLNYFNQLINTMKAKLPLMPVLENLPTLSAYSGTLLNSRIEQPVNSDDLNKSCEEPSDNTHSYA